jgi:hypothetical protein
MAIKAFDCEKRYDPEAFRRESAKRACIPKGAGIRVCS